MAVILKCHMEGIILKYNLKYFYIYILFKKFYKEFKKI